MRLGSMISGLINESVGNNMHNAPDDVLRVKRKLSDKGFFDNMIPPEPHGYVTRELDNGIKEFQAENALKIDGILKPLGETEDALLGRSMVEPLNMQTGYDATGRMIRDKQPTLFSDNIDTNTQEGTHPPVPERKPEPPPREEGQGTKPEEVKPEKEEDEQREDREREKICDDLFTDLYKVKADINDISGRYNEVLRSLNSKQAELDRLKAEYNEQYSTMVPSPITIFKKPKGPLAIMDIVDSGSKVIGVYDLTSKISELEKEVEELRNEFERIELEMNAARAHYESVSKDIENNCSDRKM